MTERLTYRDFKEELILNFAVATRAETGKFINPEDVAAQIKQDFQRSWTMAAVKELSDIGVLNGKTFISGGGSYALTGKGLERAEEIANERAFDLYDLMKDGSDEGYVIGDPDQGFVIGEPAPVLIIQIDHLSEAFKELDRELNARIQELRSDNELMVNGGAEARQRIAELEAGKTLINAEQADAGLVQRLLLPSLTWFAKKVRDESASALIKKLIALVVAFLSGAGS